MNFVTGCSKLCSLVLVVRHSLDLPLSDFHLAALVSKEVGVADSTEEARIF